MLCVSRVWEEIKKYKKACRDHEYFEYTMKIAGPLREPFIHPLIPFPPLLALVPLKLYLTSSKCLATNMRDLLLFTRILF